MPIFIPTPFSSQHAFFYLHFCVLWEFTTLLWLLADEICSSLFLLAKSAKKDRFTISNALVGKSNRPKIYNYYPGKDDPQSFLDGLIFHPECDEADRQRLRGRSTRLRIIYLTARIHNNQKFTHWMEIDRDISRFHNVRLHFWHILWIWICHSIHDCPRYCPYSSEEAKFLSQQLQSAIFHFFKRSKEHLLHQYLSW